MRKNKYTTIKKERDSLTEALENSLFILENWLKINEPNLPDIVAQSIEARVLKLRVELYIEYTKKVISAYEGVGVEDIELTYTIRK